MNYVLYVEAHSQLHGLVLYIIVSFVNRIGKRIFLSIMICTSDLRLPVFPAF